MRLFTIIIMISASLIGAAPVGVAAQEPGHGTSKGPSIPSSVRAEHEQLHTALRSAMERPGPIGSAARELARVLHPHFVREEEIALPPLGALPALARGDVPEHADVLRAMTDSLAREMPHMLEEHRAIAAAVAKLERAALRAHADEWVRFAAQLRMHARNEEEVMYPAALLVGRSLVRVAAR